MTQSRFLTIGFAVLLLTSVPALAQISPNNAASNNATLFTQGNLVISVEGCGVEAGTCSYGDNQAAPLTLFQFELNPSNPTTAPATYVNSLVLPQTSSGANGPVSGEYGSSSEGTLQLAGSLQYLTIMGYGVNAAAFNADPTLYGIPGGELGQSGSLTGQSYTPVPRVTALIDPYGNVNSSTALFNIFNANNPRSTYTADGTHIYVSGQGTSGDNTGGVFYTTLGSSSSTTITGDDAGGTASQDTRDVQIYNNTLFISMDSKSGSFNRDYIGTLGDPPATSVFTCTGVGAGCPTGSGTIGPAEMSGFGNTGGTGKETITTGSNGNGNNLNSGLAINISPENYFFASPSVLYVADSGSPKNSSNTDTVCTNDGGTGSVGNGGLQKWVNSQSNGTGTWTLAYTLYKGLNLVLNTACDPSDTDGTTGLIGLTGTVVSGNVYLYATNYTIADLDPTYLYGITDTLSFTTASQASSESFTQLAAAPSDSNFKGVSFVPTLPAGSATITSSPSGLAFTSTGTGCAPGTYTTPVTLIWTPGNSCTLSVVSPQTASGAQYTFSQWQDGTTGLSDTVTAPATSAVYTASFTTTTSISVTSVTPSAEDYGSTVPVAISATLTWAGNGPTPTASDVAIAGSGLSGSFGTTSCGAPSGNTMTCSNTYTPSGNDVPGAYTMTASFSGDSNYSGSSSPQTANFTINDATSTTEVTSSGSPSTYGQAVTFTATINGENGNIKGRTRKNGVKQQIVTGTVMWSANTGCGTTGVSSGNPGTASCTTSVLPVGSSDTITATYSGDSNHTGSTGTLSGGQEVSEATTSISVSSVGPTNEDYAANTPVTITAVLSWSGSGTAPNAGNVTISGNGPGTYGSTACGSASGDTMTCTATYTPNNDPAGSYNETAAFADDGNYTASSAAPAAFTINQATSTTSVTSSSNNNTSTYGDTVTFTATVTGENGDVKGRAGRNGKVKSNDVTGTVNWSANTGCSSSTVSGYPGVATCTTSALNAGSDTVTASYSGDANHGSSNGSVIQTVNQAAATVTLSNMTQTYTGSALSPTVTTVPAGLNITPTGYPDTNAGSYSVTATVNNPNYTGSASGTFTINKATQTITLTNVPASAAYNSMFTVTASASSGLTVALSSSGGCSNSGANYTMTSGTTSCLVTAQQTGNGNYTAATPVNKTVAATKINPSVTFTGLATSLPYGSTYTLTTTTTASTTASITDATSSVCTLSGSTVSIVKTSGNCEVTATWPADQNYNSATLSQTGTATKAIGIVSWGTPAAIPYGTPLSATQLDASISPSADYKTPTYSPALGKIEPVGTYTLKATFAASNSNYAVATGTVSLVVTQASSTTSITTPSPTVTLNRNGTVSVKLASNVVSYKPTGSVTLTATTGEVCSGAVMSGTGDSSCSLIFTTTGTRTITATYSGDANHTGSNNSTQSPAVTVTVNP